MTFSIVGFDPDTGSWGIAVASKFLAVGSVVPWGRAGAGAIATQAMANLSYGPDGLGLLAERFTAEQVVDVLTRADGERDHRQLGVVDATGGGRPGRARRASNGPAARRGTATPSKATS